MPAVNLTHPTPVDLAAFAVGLLDDAQAEAVAAHLGECESCRVAVENAPTDSFADQVKAAEQVTLPPVDSVAWRARRLRPTICHRNWPTTRGTASSANSARAAWAWCIWPNTR